MVAAVAGLVLTGCGDESNGGPGGTTSSTPTTTQSTPAGTVLPITVTRSGGVAGFNDLVVIGTDGVATVSSRGKGTVRCKLDPSLLGSLTAAAQQVDWTGLGATKPTTRYPDDMIIAVSANGGTARLEDPELKPMAAPVSKLLTEATIPPGPLCQPV